MRAQRSAMTEHVSSRAQEGTMGADWTVVLIPVWIMLSIAGFASLCSVVATAKLGAQAQQIGAEASMKYLQLKSRQVRAAQQVAAYASPSLTPLGAFSERRAAHLARGVRNHCCRERSPPP